MFAMYHILATHKPNNPDSLNVQTNNQSIKKNTKLIKLPNPKK